MKSGTKKRLAAGLTAGAMMLAIASPVAMAQPTQITSGNLIAALNNVNVEITDVVVRDVVDVNNNTVNVNALQNFLNRNDVNIDIRNFLNNNDVDILNNLVTIQGIEILNDAYPGNLGLVAPLRHYPGRGSLSGPRPLLLSGVLEGVRRSYARGHYIAVGNYY